MGKDAVLGFDVRRVLINIMIKRPGCCVKYEKVCVRGYENNRIAVQDYQFILPVQFDHCNRGIIVLGVKYPVGAY